MRIYLRKTLAMVLSVLMLCTLLPLSAVMSVSAADTKLNLNWNDGTLGFDQGSVVTGGPDGSNCFKWAAGGGWSATYITVSNMDPNKDYVITLKAKASVAGNMGITIQNGDWGSYWNGPNFAVTTSWKDITIEIAANQYPFAKGTILFKFQDTGVAMDLYVDDLVIAEKATEPTPEPETPATSSNLVINGDFENGKTGWNTSSAASIVSGGRSGSAIQLNNPSAWSEAALQNIDVEADTNYTLTWYAKRVSGTGVFNVDVAKSPFDGTKPTVTAIENQTWMNETSGNWVKYQVNVKTTDANGNGITKIMIKLTTEANNPGILLIDDITLTKDTVASFDGYITNGDFETGSAIPWTVYSSTTVNTTAKYAGNYGLYLGGSGDWGGLAYQEIKNLKKGQEYIATMMIKVVSGGVNIQIKGSNLNGDSIVSQYRSASNSSSWTEVTMTWTADAATAHINICGDGTGTAAVAYVDNIVVSGVASEISPEEELSYGGSSIKENSDGAGLAFRFMVSATDGQRTSKNEYVENSGKVTLGKDQYTLVRFGAVLTNKQAVGTTDFTLDNVNGANVIDIKGVYLAGLEINEISFAVRIVDIPADKYHRDIYARPYYVYEKDGEEIIVYGDIVSDTYEKAANPKSSIKILSIGHSFSKDVMETYLWNMFKEGGYDEVVIGYLYMAGCSMPKHLYNIQNNLAQYEYGKNTNGEWQKKYNTSALTALQDEDWDYVNIQSSPDYVGGQEISGFKLGVNNDGQQITLSSPMTEYECISPITDWIVANAKNKAVKTDYNMIWSFSQGCNLWSYTYHNYNQMTMYKNIIAKTKELVKPHNAINNIIPCATSIQNARSSFMGDNFNMPDATQGGNDGYHLNDHGDYVAALTWYCHYSKDDASVMAGYTGDLSEREFAAIAEAVNNAMKSPYEVTDSTYKTAG